MDPTHQHYARTEKATSPCEHDARSHAIRQTSAYNTQRAINEHVQRIWERQAAAIPTGIRGNEWHEHAERELDAIGDAEYGESASDDYPAIEKSLLLWSDLSGSRVFYWGFL